MDHPARAELSPRRQRLHKLLLNGANRPQGLREDAEVFRVTTPKMFRSHEQVSVDAQRSLNGATSDRPSWEHRWRVAPAGTDVAATPLPCAIGLDEVLGDRPAAVGCQVKGTTSGLVLP